MRPKFNTRAEFVPGTRGDVFVMSYEPCSSVSRNVYFVPPFAEEMNKSRRMVALQSRLFAAHGARVIVHDPFGTGDSYGEFADARLQTWRNDILAHLEDIRSQNSAPIWIWGMRMGALIALDAIRRSNVLISGVVLWNPCPNGLQYMNQFLRLRLMSTLVSKNADRETLADLRDIVASGKSIEVAGYQLSAELIAAIDQLELDKLLHSHTPVIHWMEVSNTVEGSLSPAIRKSIESASKVGSTILVNRVAGPAFWSTPEVSHAPDLLEATMNVVD